MGQIFAPADRQVKASGGNRSQAGMPFLAIVPGMQQLTADLVERVTFNGALIEAAHHSGLEDQQIAEQIHICAGYMSRAMRGVWQQWAKRLVQFMRVTQSLAPLQWLADKMGCDVVPRDSRAAEVAALRARLQELQGASVA